MMLRSRLVVLVLVVLFVCSGCRAEKRVTPWAPQPQVHWTHVSTAGVPHVQEGYRILKTGPTEGLFPASMAVTRLGVDVIGDEGKVTRPYLLTDPRNEFLRWNRAFDDLLAVGEVFPVVELDLGGGVADPSQIVAACRALGAKLGLIYAVNERSPNSAEMFGVLYETGSARPLAVLHAQATSAPVTERQAEDDVDPWKTQARALVREKFESRLHACVHELIHRDKAELIEAPAGWTPAGPIRPVEWPPTYFRGTSN